MKKSCFAAAALVAACSLCQPAAAQGALQSSQPEMYAHSIVNAPIVNLPEEAEYAYPVVITGEAFNNDSVLFPLGGNQFVRGLVTKTRNHSDVSTGWSGTIEGIEYGWFSFVQYKDAFHGAISAGELGTFELRDSGQNDANGNDIYNLIKFDMSKFKGCGNDQLEAHGVAQRIMQQNQRVAMSRQIARNTGTTPGGSGVTIPGITPELDDGSVIDVMIVYTAEARQGWGGTNQILALAQNSIDVTNEAYDNSQISPLELNLVHTEEVNYNESGSASTDITRLQGTSDGFMDNVHALRDTYAADLVALLVNDFNACGVGYLAPFNESLGFTVTDTGCAVGNLSFPHEIGHNMGCAHDRDNAGGSTFSYAYGHRWTSTNGGRYRSIMAYSQGGDTRVRHFSNPGVNYIGTATGVNNSEDNGRCHEETKFSVSNFRDSLGCIDYTIFNQPDSQTACPGDNITLSTGISGDLGSLTFEWRKNGNLIAGATSNVLQLNNIDASDAGSYVLTIIEPCSTETTDTAVLTVDDAFAIDQDPQSQTVDEGDNVSFTVTASGADSYQWFGPSGLLVFEENPTLNLTSVDAGDAGEYYCFVSGPCNQSGENSAVATLTVNTPNDCLADVNGDGAVTPADFTAWVNAYNNNAPECDQNGDGSCTPADFTAWVNNFNAGC